VKVAERCEHARLRRFEPPPPPLTPSAIAAMSRAPLRAAPAASRRRSLRCVAAGPTGDVDRVHRVASGEAASKPPMTAVITTGSTPFIPPLPGKICTA